MIELGRCDRLKKIVKARRAGEIPVRKKFSVHQRPGVERTSRPQTRNERAENDLAKNPGRQRRRADQKSTRWVYDSRRPQAQRQPEHQAEEQNGER